MVTVNFTSQNIFLLLLDLKIIKISVGTCTIFVFVQICHINDVPRWAGG